MSELTPTPENKAENKELTAEQLSESYDRIESSLEKSAEKSKVENGEKNEHEARVEALKQAVSVESGSAEKKRGKEPAATKKRHGVVSKKERDASYKQRMKHVQEELPPAQKAFSKVIHNPAVEKVSGAVGSTVARPNAILSGAIVAFVLVLAVYLISKHFGYVLSGFETIAAFVAGWVIGLLYDFFKTMITGKK